MRYLTLLIVLLASVAVAAPPEQYDELDFYDVEVITPQRRPIERWKTAENITIITAEQIDEWGVHTVAEALNMVPGLFISSAQDFGSPSLITAQGSEERHVAVKVDDIPWNYLSGGSAETAGIPVGIIDRIEVVKGPGSSSWGSALGGVINIITKAAGFTSRPHGKVGGMLGENSTNDLRAELYGRVDDFGYYAHGNSMHSDGFVDGRGLNSGRGFLKGLYSFGGGINLTVMGGINDQDMGTGKFPTNGIESRAEYKTSYMKASLDMDLSSNMLASLSFYHKQTDPTFITTLLNGGGAYQTTEYDEKLSGASGKIVLKRGKHSVVIGSDWLHGKLDQSIENGDALQAYGLPMLISGSSSVDEWAVYTNGTFVFGDFSATPGVRYDHSDITGSFISPSLGLTYRLGDAALLKATVARGFTAPGLSHTSVGGLFLDPNPSLDVEDVWSFQGGAEVIIGGKARFVVTAFSHRLSDAQEREDYAGGAPLFNDLITNQGDVNRDGFEVGIDMPMGECLSVAANATYSHVKYEASDKSKDMISANADLAYRNPKYIDMLLRGHFVRWDDLEYPTNKNSMLWDAVIRKSFNLCGVPVTASCKVHNIFNGSQPAKNLEENPRRWIEARVTFNF